MEESEDPETSFSKVDNVGAVDEGKEHASNEGQGKEHASDEGEDDAANDSVFPKPIDAKGADVGKTSDVELDPIELAQKVAIEVYRDIMDHREPSCSSSGKTSSGRIRQPDSPASTSENQSEPIEGPANEEAVGSDQSADDLPMGGEPLVSKENQDTGPEKCIQDTESSQVTETAQEPEANSEKGFCSQDIGHPGKPISTVISVVSASKAEAASGLPVAPLQFEGNLGWKGSAATSAFRPASPRRSPEDDKSLSTVESPRCSKRRQDYFDIDLNVAEDEDEKMTDVAGDELPVSGLPSGEYAVDASPARLEKLKLDLNRVSDDGDATSSDWRIEGRLYHRNGHISPSPSSYSSSMQPALRNIDLNDQPSFFNDSSDHPYGPYLGKSSLSVNTSGGLKSDDTVISIMGTRVEVNRKDTVSQILPLPNGRILEPAVDVNLVRSGGVLGMGSAVPYAHSPVYGYNGLTLGPTAPFSSTMYGPGGPIPYMVDSRGAPVIPQIFGSVSALPPAFSQPPFIMRMASTSSSSNGVGTSRHNFDLNSGLYFEGGNSNSFGFRQLFNGDQGRSLNEHLRANSQPAAVVGERRKEPDGGWEPYPFNYNHHQPPWK